MLERDIEKFANGMRLVRGDHIVIRFILLKHQPHGLDVFLGISPIPFGIEISEIQFLLETRLDVRHGPGDFAGLAPVDRQQSVATAPGCDSWPRHGAIAIRGRWKRY